MKTLTEFCKHITVVAPKISPDLLELVKQEKIKWRHEEYHKEVIWDADMVFAATNRPEVNRKIKKDCLLIKIETGKRILFNAIDSKEACDFYFPAIVQTDEMVVGINSSGRNPRMTKYVREEIEKLLECDSIYK